MIKNIDNKISHQGMKYLGEAVRCNNTIQTLKLQKNYNFGSEGMKNLSESFQFNYSIHDIDLRWNNIGIEGEKWSEQFLKRNLIFNRKLKIIIQTRFDQQTKNKPKHCLLFDKI